MKKSLLITLAAAVMLLSFTRVSAQVPEQNIGIRLLPSAMPDNGAGRLPKINTFAFGIGPVSRLHRVAGQDMSVTYGLQISLEDCHRSTMFFGYSAGVDFGTYRKTAYTLSASLLENADLTEMYLDFPVRIRLYIPFSRRYQAYLFGGLVPSLCLGSHFYSEEEHKYVSSFDEGPNGSRVDLLAGGGMGLEINDQVRIALGYDYGLLDRDRNEGPKLLVSAIKLNMSYFF